MALPGLQRMEWQMSGLENNPSEHDAPASHFHPCPHCGEVIECFCPFPELSFNDLFAICPECAAKEYLTQPEQHG
jgi:hypothetical protein